jgi:hypothetical protein
MNILISRSGKMRREKIIPVSLLVLLLVQGLAVALFRPVPQQYPTIQDAINASINGDIVVVSPGVYTGLGNRDIDFQNKAITVQSSINPANPNWDTIANTIIDCQGTRWNNARAFDFHSGEGAGSKVLGFTIRNGYIAGAVGADAIIPGLPLDPNDPNGPARADSGADAAGNGFGGAILCTDASPTIQYCVITNCTVTGGQGGDGADGNDAPEGSGGDGQWGGHGGHGDGSGFGGTIACVASAGPGPGSFPTILDCIFTNNVARGSVGGDGGDGGDGDGSGKESSGGNGGWAGAVNGSGTPGDGTPGAPGTSNDGFGGSIYADIVSTPVITNCTFSNSVATNGLGGLGGTKGAGSALDPPATAGTGGGFYYLVGGIGGAILYNGGGLNPTLTNCNFTGSEARLSFPSSWGWLPSYTFGGAVFSGNNNTLTLTNCNFTGNRGGAVCCATASTLNITNSLFENNTDVLYGGAVLVDVASPSVTINNSAFNNNSAYDHGGALISLATNTNLTNCSFGGNRADSDGDGTGDGGAIEAYDNFTPATLTQTLNSCTFTSNEAVSGGAVHFHTFQNSSFTDCYFLGNTAESGGGLSLVGGTANITGGAVSGNHATDEHGFGGGIDCINTALTIADCVIQNNLADGANARGGAINFYGGFVAHQLKNCLIIGNSATVNGGAKTPQTVLVERYSATGAVTRRQSSTAYSITAISMLYAKKTQPMQLYNTAFSITIPTAIMGCGIAPQET